MAEDMNNKPQFSGGCKQVKLVDVCEILDSKRIPITKNKRIAGPYPYYGANGIQDHVADFLFDDELVLLAEDGGHFEKDGQIAYRVSGKCWVNNHAHVLKAKDDVDIDYLCYALQSFDVSSLVNGATRKKLTQSAMKKITLPLRSVDAQLAIVNSLKTVEIQLADALKLLSSLDDLVKSRFIEIFGDCRLARQDQGWKRIGNIGEVLGGATPKTQVEEYWGGGLPWLTPAEIGDSIYVNATSRTLTSEGVRSCSLSKLPAGTVLLSSRAPIGKVAIAGTDMYCNQGFKNIVCGDSVLPRYLYSLLKFNSDYLNSLGRGATFTEISKRIVEDIKIPVPAVEFQLQFECFAQQVDKLRFDVQQQIDKLELLKNSLMQEYFG